MEDRSGQVLVINVVFFSITWIFVLLRVYTRAWLIKSWGVDDWTMFAAQLLFTGYLVCQLGGLYYGTARLDKDLTADARLKALRYWWFCELFYTPATATLKVAVGLFLLRIAVKRAHILVIHIMNTANVILSLAYLFVFIFQCNPVHTFWTIKPNNEHCMPVATIAGFAYAAASLASLADWIYGIVPGFIVWDLQMNKRTKLVVVGILAFAAVGSMATLIRMPYIKGFEATHDFLYESTDIAIWSTIEPGIGITAACIATLRPLLQHVLHRTGLSTPDTRTGTHGFGSQYGLGHVTGSKSANGPRRGYIRSPSYTMENLRPNEGTTTTTIVTGRGDKTWRDDSSGGSEEGIIPGVGMATGGFGDIQVSKTVHITHVATDVDDGTDSPAPSSFEGKHGRKSSRGPRRSDESFV